MSPDEADMRATPLGMLMESSQLLKEGRKLGIRIVATPTALASLHQLAELHGEEGRKLFQQLASNIVSTDHLHEPNVFPGVKLPFPSR